MAPETKTRPPRPSPPEDQIIYVHGDPNLRAEQVKKYGDLRKRLAQRLAEAEKMTEAENREPDEEWRRFKKAMNESRAGYRIPYPD